MEVVSFSALGTGCLYPQGNIPGTHFCLRLSRPHGHCATGRFMSMKNSVNTIWNDAISYSYDLKKLSAKVEGGESR
jgi:hypothetical protein